VVVFRHLLSIAILVLSFVAAPLGAAFAAPPVISAYNWGGFYIEGDANMSTLNSTWNFDWRIPQLPSRPSGFSPLGTVGFGYDTPILQFPLATIMIGGVLDGSFGTTTGTDDCFGGRVNCTTFVQNDFTARGVIGVAVPNQPVEFYGTAGLAVASITDLKTVVVALPMNRFVNLDPLIGGVNKEQVGWAAGGGIVYQAFGPGQLSPALPGAVSFDLQLLYQDFGNTTPTRGITINEYLLQWKVGARYSFGPSWDFANWGRPGL